MTVLSFVASYFLRNRIEISNTQFNAALSDYVSLSFYLIPALIIIYALNGLYYSRSSKSVASEFYRIFESNSALIALLVLALFFSKTSYISRLIIAFTWALSILFVFLARFSIRITQKILLKYGIGRRNLLVIGSNGVARFLASEINKNPWSGYKFIGVLDGEERKDIRILGGISEFKEVCHKYKIDEAIAIENKISKTVLNEIINYCAKNNISLKFVPGVVAEFSIKLHPSSIGSMPVLEAKNNALDGWGRIIKRAIDIFLASVFLLVFSPLLIIIALVQKITSKGPVIYSHQRVGRDGKIFLLYKFRSMYDHAEDKENRYWTEDNDSRITPFGRILRKSNLDELPQFYNILRGDMSFVGPRPEQPRFVEKFSQEVPGYILRHRVKSGLTGWAQINGLKGDTSVVERARYDSYYIENWSVFFDLLIIIRTAWMVLYEIFKGKYEYRADS